MMKSLFENPNLNINSWLINWGFLNGYLKDGLFIRTKFGQINQWFCVLTMILNAIKFSILLFTEKESKISKQLGEWSYFLAPRIMMNAIITIGSCCTIIVVIFFNLCCRNYKKLFYWLDNMEYHVDNRCFPKINLNDCDSKLLTKRMSLFIMSLYYFTVPYLLCFVAVNCFCVFRYVNDYHYYFNYFISIISFLPSLYFYLNYIFGFLGLLYLVRFILLFIHIIIYPYYHLFILLFIHIINYCDNFYNNLYDF